MSHIVDVERRCSAKNTEAQRKPAKDRLTSIGSNKSKSNFVRDELSWGQAWFGRGCKMVLSKEA